MLKSRHDGISLSRPYKYVGGSNEDDVEINAVARSLEAIATISDDVVVDDTIGAMSTTSGIRCGNVRMLFPSSSNAEVGTYRILES